MSAGFGEDAARQQTHKQTERDTDEDKPPKQTNKLNLLLMFLVSATAGYCGNG